MKTHFIIIFLGVSGTFPSRSFTQCSINPSQNLVAGYRQSPLLCSDSAGGAHVTRILGLTFQTSIRLHRLDHLAYRPCGSYIVIRGELAEAPLPSIAANDGKGVMIAYLDREFHPPNGLLEIAYLWRDI